MARFSYTRQAEADLDGVFAYISEDNPGAAEKAIDLFEEKARMLAEYPGMGTDRSDLHTDLRSFPVGNYMIYYR